jgi:hypothetical protein
VLATWSHDFSLLESHLESIDLVLGDFGHLSGDVGLLPVEVAAGHVILEGS